jgi:hypothetical protein
MPNPVAANDLQPISGSLQTSRISYGVETAGKNYGQDYNGTTWYSDIPNNGQFYTIISDNYTANYYVSRSNAEGAYVEGGLPAVDEYSAPVFWTTVGTSSLDIITIVNGLPDRIGQTPFVSGAQALNWIASSSNYFAVGPNYYEQIDADQLQLYLEVNQIISYPTTGSTWYDLSGNGKNGTLYNGPTFSAVSGAIIFDGTDDYVQGPIPNQNPAAATLEVWYNTTADEAFPGENRLLFLGTGFAGPTDPGISLRLRDDRVAFAARKADNSGYWDIFSGATVIDGRWKHVIGTFDTTAIKRYENGVLTEQTATGQNYLTASDAYTIAGQGAFFDGKIAKARFYSKTLTESEVLQNYYGGPIVTGSISGSYQAGNLVSYSPNSAATYNMVNNKISGSLQNGVLYNPTNGGYWSFDGSDDRILLEGSTQNAWILNSAPAWTVNAWIRVPNGSSTGTGLAYQGILSNTSGGPIYSVFQVANSTIAYAHYNGTWIYEYGSIPVNDGNWHMLTWVNEADNMTFYVDSIPDGTVNSSISGVGWLDVIGNSLGTAFLGDIASVQINQGKAFTASEVLQQYNATK